MPQSWQAWDEVRCHIHYQGSVLDLRVTKEGVEISNRSQREVPLCFAGRQITLGAREQRYLEM